MKHYRLPILVMASCSLLATSCSDDDPKTPAAQAVSVTVEKPADAEAYTVLSEQILFHNISTGTDETFTTLNDISLIPGLYDVTYTAEVEMASNAAKAQIRANASSVQVESGKPLDIRLTSYLNIPSDDLIIAEIFFTGTQQPSGNQYMNDQYIKLYNNTDHIVYADGITLFGSSFMTVSKYDYTPDIMGQAVTVEALYTVPGNGTEHPVQPGEYFIIANNAMNHTLNNPYSFDLSHADVEWYDESTNPNFTDTDNPAVPNMDKWYSNTLTVWSLHNRGFKAYGIARIPLGKEEYLGQYRYDYTYDMVLPSGTFPMSGNGFKVLNEWILDCVNLSIEAMYKWNVTSPAIDCGWTHCGSVDKDMTRYFKSVRRKLLYVTGYGRAVLKDTNNSTADFNGDAVPSEAELQGTPMNVDGQRATTVTYDGVTPVKK